ncbi:universal stress protein [Saccharothrix mutabilis subsp. mutabilis]|uniref:Universal stress protein n=1 Tax=Saccharothrix mutabilis subsp. mutabilis TaxID=66855 RepID=A0ABN0UV80_9PSEU
MDQTVVVGVDGSPASRAAFRWAVEEGERRGCAVEVIHAWHVDHALVIGPVSASVAAAMDTGALRDGHRAVLDEVVGEVETDVEVRPALVEGDARDVLVKASEHAALLVVGSRGVGPIREVLLGSVGSYCVHHAKCPVVVLRQPEPERPEPKPVVTPGPLL